jgi:hypothetical protein
MGVVFLYPVGGREGNYSLKICTQQQYYGWQFISR